ncbi:aminoglycoside phosphotransferase family protein [Cognatishimia activa]|uniref:aminoglycoside phosphotransferase family protein n=1 Tax=Cognatishimia activa TaxID=1715691 RepID=UPI00222F2EEA|nr:phosphotransferase [Cognatishimia activa]UZD90735.1 phosphotransferase [Cognatishimia activa]
MSDRENKIQKFIKQAGWDDAKRAPLAGDASNRRYERLLRPDGECAVLMDAPPERGEDTRPFVKIANYLTSHGLSAPKIFASDERHGFLLLEDLGDALYARVVEEDSPLERPLYTAAIDALIALHNVAPPADLPAYSAQLMAEKAAMAWRWYLDRYDPSNDEKALRIEALLETVLAPFDQKSDVLIQRDYHAENLIWLPDRSGVAKVGMLDFQDALKGHRAYDLVSLLQDARRDVSEDLEQAMIAHYLDQTGLDQNEFVADYHLLGLQRNLRILGVFARLSLHFGKAHYVDFIPRVWGYIERDLKHPATDEIREQVLAELPAPTPAHLQRLRDLCGTVPTP